MSQQDPISTYFIIRSDDNIPIYNSLIGGYTAGSEKNTDFTKQFQFPKLEILKYKVDIPIHLHNLTYSKPTNYPINVFTNYIIQKPNRNKIIEKNQQTNKVFKPHIFSTLKAQTVKNQQTTTLVQQLRPVPLIKLNKKQQSYTKDINSIVGYNPVSAGTIEASNLMIGIVIGFILFFMFLRMAFGKQIKLFLSAAFNHLRADNIQKNRYLVTTRASSYINILYFATLGLYLQHQLDFMGLNIISYSQLQSFLTLSFFITILYGVKWFFGSVLSQILKIKDLNKAYFFHIFIYNKLFALVSFPIILSLPYISSTWLNIIFKGILYFAITLYILRFSRILIFSIQRKLSLFYLFLYLCALEIIPFLVIVILVQNWLKIAVL